MREAFVRVVRLSGLLLLLPLASASAGEVCVWTSGAALLAGDGELVIEIDASEPSSFYRVVVSDIAP